MAVVATIKKINIHNKSRFDLINFELLYAANNKATDLTSYMFDWRTVNIVNGDNVSYKQTITIGNVKSNSLVSVDCNLRTILRHRSYWQIFYETPDGSTHSIDKNNAQCNVWGIDDGKELDLFIIEEGSYLRVDFILPSGKAYFYIK
jgi:hypothetical protein